MTRKRLKQFIWLLLVIVIIATSFLTLFHPNNSHKKINSYKAELINSHQLTIGLEGTYAPYSYRKNGKLAGFEVDLGKKIAKTLGLKAIFIPTKWDGLVAGLGSKKFDIILNDITITPERKKSFLFSIPYIYSKTVLITKKNNQSIKNLKDIKGHKFAEGTGTNNELVAKKFKAKIIPSGDFVTSLSLIRQGRVKGTINAIDAWKSYAKNNSIKGLKYQVIPPKEEKPAKVSALLSKKSPKLKNEVNLAIKKLRSQGTLKKLSKRYFNSDITKNN